VDSPYKLDIGAPTLGGAGNTIRFNGGQSGNSVGEAVEGSVLIGGSSASLSVYADSNGYASERKILVNRGDPPSNDAFDASTLNANNINFSNNGTVLWIRLQLKTGTTVLSSRYYKVQVFLPPTDLADNNLRLSPNGGGASESVYLYAGGAGTLADPVLGAVTISSGSYTLNSTYGGGTNVLVNPTAPSVDSINFAVNPINLIKTTTTLWVRIQAYENAANGDPVYKIYKINLTVK
jgi:hypothetical protein